jgi:1-acylglycerone phosphate reductase
MRSIKPVIKFISFTSCCSNVYGEKDRAHHRVRAACQASVKANRTLIFLSHSCTPGGIGHALARTFHSQGLHVIATARDREKIKDLEVFGMTTLSLEVTSLESILAVKQAVSDLTGGGLDILVNNA